MTKAMKKVTGSLKVDLAQFRAMEAFAMFASDLDAASRQQLDRGQRLMALLKQPQYSPYPVEEMAASLWTGTTRQASTTCRPTTCCASRRSSSTTCAARTRASSTASASRTTSPTTPASAIEDAYDSFLDQFETSEGGSIKAGKEEHEALEDEDVEQEQIVKQKRG